MHRMRLLGLGFIVAGAFSASASAASGPSYYVNSKSLKAGETRLLLVRAKESFEFTFSAIKLKCTGATLPDSTKMHVEGVAVGNGGKSKEILEFTECTVTGNGAECEVEEKRLVTVPIINTLGYSRAERMGPVLVLFEPEGANQNNNKVLSTLKFTGSCTVTTIPLTGQFIGESFENGKAVEIDLTKLGTESSHGELHFRASAPKTIWLENGGTLKTVKTKLETGLGAFTFIGTLLVLVDEAGAPVKWGVFW